MQHAGHMMGASQPLDALLLLGTGLAMSFGHCLGMCGPLVGAIAAVQRRRGMGAWALAGAQLIHHAGRISSYVLIGFGAAALGSSVRLAGVGRGLQGALSIGVGLLMLLLGLGLLGVLPTRRWIESGWLASRVVGVTGRLRDRAGGPAWFLIGMANGFLPCGPVYAVAVGTMAAAPPAGAAAMLLFGVGTIPALVLFALGAGQLSPAVQRHFNRAAAFLVMLIGLQLACRGLAALGWIGHFRIGELVIW